MVSIKAVGYFSFAVRSIGFAGKGPWKEHERTQCRTVQEGFPKIMDLV